MIFNKHCTEIIKLAINKDPELHKQLKLMLSNLTEEQKANIRNHEQFSTIQSLEIKRKMDLLNSGELTAQQASKLREELFKLNASFENISADNQVCAEGYAPENSVEYEVIPEYLTSFLTVESVNKETLETTEYELDLYGFDRDDLETVDNLPSVESISDENRPSGELLYLMVRNSNSQGKLTSIKEYVLELVKVLGEYHLYYTRTNDDCLGTEDSTMLEAESLTTIGEEELLAIADLDCNLSL